MAERVTTACPRNCYSTCALSVRVEGGRTFVRATWDEAIDTIAAALDRRLAASIGDQRSAR